MQMNGFFKKGRLWITFVAVMALLIYIFSVYVKLALSKPEDTQQLETAVVERGSIVDRNGNPLAVQTNFYNIGITPKSLKTPQDFVQNASEILGLNGENLLSKINNSMNQNFIYIKKKCSQEEYDKMYKLYRNRNFIKFEKVPGRLYPNNSLASQLIGYMGDDGVGLSGIEYSQQRTLSPTPQPSQTGTIYGNNVYLTIDATLQYKLERIAQDAMNTTQAESIMMITADAKNGEILSYISLPSANLNEYTKSTAIERLDRPAVTSYEPGSVFKVFTSAAYLDAGAISPSQTFECDGLYSKTTNRGETIRISCLEHHGMITVREALKYSCNDALAQMSDYIDTNLFLDYIHKFGFGEKTGVELPGETFGSVKTQDDTLWSARSKPTMSIGQEISVSALQMVEAATAISNGGVPVKLSFISKVKDKDGNIIRQHQPEYGERVLKSSTANYMLSYMETTAQSGTGQRAALGDISIGVKTGTAQMADHVHGGYSDTDFLSNCIAIFPVENPSIILYIVIQKAKGETYAGRIVAPVIHSAADEIIDHLGLNRSSASSYVHSGTVTITDNGAIVLETTVPNFIGRPKRDLVPLLDRDDVQFNIKGEGWVVSQYPEPGTPITENMKIDLTLE